MLRIICSLLFLLPIVAFGQKHIPFSAQTSLTWQECIERYQKLDKAADEASLDIIGTTDVGKPLHLFVINKDKVFYPELFDRKKTVVLINNAIHPGEPDGVDASVMLCEELLSPNSPLHGWLDSVIICIVPMFNVDGALRRNNYTRANQDGPVEYGFRGNGRNLDLNRDFIKCDSRNTQSLEQAFQRIKPHVFLDNHVSDGADYTYYMTLITSQVDKLGPMGKFVREKMEPSLYAGMKKRGWEMSPYVNMHGDLPESGLEDFLETPRFATGYAALFNTIGFVSETHMLKPFPQRVESNYQLMCELLEYCRAHSAQIVEARRKADMAIQNTKTFSLEFEVDTTKIDSVLFKGYTPVFSESKVGKGTRLRYDHEQPWERNIPQYHTFKGSQKVECPRAYVVPQAWHEVVDRLRMNGVLMKQFDKDTTMVLWAYHVEEAPAASKPYEGHFLHHDVLVRKERLEVQLFAGDYLVNTNQPARRYLVESLEPQGGDSFFAWNFFDSVLQQKEWFSDYVFEDVAADLLEKNPKLKLELEEAMAKDENLAMSHWKQLGWVYQRSPNYERTAFRYPVYRIED